jgi:hypothetical protein
MKIKFLLLLVGFTSSGVANELPWAFQNGSAEGYSLELLSAVPTPGTSLCVGEKLTFEVAAKYELSISNEGKVVLVFQDDANNLIGDGAQVSVLVKSRDGTVSLSETITVPATSEVRVFIPLVPAEMERTEGELVLRYPTKKCI